MEQYFVKIKIIEKKPHNVLKIVTKKPNQLSKKSFETARKISLKMHHKDKVNHQYY